MTTSALVPGLLPVAIDGHPYLCDPDIQRQTVQVIRTQADASNEPGEQSLTPLGLWRRSQETWHHGAGQAFLDGREGLSAYSTTAADPHRFRSSKGVDIWTRGQAGLLNKVLTIWSSTATNLALLVLGEPVFGSQTYIVDGRELYFTFTVGNLVSFNTSSIETDTSGWQTGVWSAGVWSGGGNTTLSRSTVWASDGAASLQLTPSGAGTITAGTATGTGGIPVDPGRRYVGGYWMRADAAASARVNTIYFDWYDAAGAYISTATTTVPIADSTTSTSGMAMTAGGGAVGPLSPSNAAYAAVRTSYASVSGAGDIHRIDGVYFAPAIGPFTNVGVYRTADIQAGQAPQTVQSVATNGTYIWAALGVSGIHRTAIGQTTSTADVPGGTFSVVGYANGRLLAANDNVLYEITAPISAPAAVTLMTHDNPGFVWKGIAPGRNCIYAFGNAGTNGEVYRITLEATTTALAAPTHCTYLPDGEPIFALTFYAGGIIMGTGLGIRLGQADSQGNIDYGPLIRTPYPVRCLEPQDRYCWFGWSNYDGTSTGLGRIDLGFFTDTLIPAYASDLMVAAQGEVLSAVTYIPYLSTTNLGVARLFAVSGVGVFMEDLGTIDSGKVASGQLLTGTIRYSTSEPKLTRSVDLRHHALPAGAAVAVEMQRDSSGTWEALGTSSTVASYGPAAPLDALSERAEALEFRYTLTRGTDLSKGPELTRWTAKVLPLPSTIDETFTLNLHMKTTVDTTAADGQPYRMDVPTEMAYLKGLEQSRQLVTLQVGSDSYTVYMVATQFQGTQWESPLRRFAEGKMTVQLQTVRG